MSELPISCIRCRRRKIKCNKRDPCNQCVGKGLTCEFPAKFRNVKYRVKDEGLATATDTLQSNLDLLRRQLSADEVAKLLDEVALLRKEKLAVLHENFKLTQRNHDLKTRLSQRDRASNVDLLLDHGFEISGETTELGDKYYGPQLLNFMIELLRSNQDQDEQPEQQPERAQPAPPQDHRDSELQLEKDDEDAPLKKPLPWVVDDGDSAAHNRECLRRLLASFFRIKLYSLFISHAKLLDFIDTHDSVLDSDWEGDDDLVLLHMVLILAVQRLSPIQYNEIGLSRTPVDSLVALGKRTGRLIKKSLCRGFTQLRHNLLNESIVTVQAYILCTEWYFIDQRYEEAWLMMFHCCAVAYSIGLHVVFNLRTTNDSPEKASMTIAEMTKQEDIDDADDLLKEDSPQLDQESDNDYDVQRLKVWFALRNITGQMCSILGRPNPISIQVNLAVLGTCNVASLSKLHLELRVTQVQLRLGLSECIRLSNMMLIESFMMNFTTVDIVNLERKFAEEAETLAYFASPKYQAQVADQPQTVNLDTDMPTIVPRQCALTDLIILHINKAKLLEPFLNQFVGIEESRLVFEAICDSIVSFLDYTCEFVLQFIEQEVPDIVDSEGKVFSKIRMGKVFRMKYPFLNSFIYQGIIVIFTLLSYKAKEFIQGDYSEFLGKLEARLNALLQLDSKVSDLVHLGVHLWSTNIIFLVNKDLQHINMILRKAEEFKSSAQNSDASGAPAGLDDAQQLTEILGFNLRDPFWMANPDNIPNYLSSPSEDDNPFNSNQIMEEQLRNMELPSDWQQQTYQSLNAQAQQQMQFNQEPKLPQQFPGNQQQFMPQQQMNMGANQMGGNQMGGNLDATEMARNHMTNNQMASNQVSGQMGGNRMGGMSLPNQNPGTFGEMQGGLLLQLLDQMDTDNRNGQMMNNTPMPHTMYYNNGNKK